MNTAFDLWLKDSWHIIVAVCLGLIVLWRTREPLKFIIAPWLYGAEDVKRLRGLEENMTANNKEIKDLCALLAKQQAEIKTHRDAMNKTLFRIEDKLDAISEKTQAQDVQIARLEAKINGRK